MDDLAPRIIALLRRVNGEKLTVRMIAKHLGMIVGETGEAWQNMARICFEVAKLAEYHRIEDNGIYSWIDPPRDPTGMLIR